MANFGRYEILDKLGEGAMGVVHRARDTTLGRVIALKLLANEGSSEELRQRFLREAEAIGCLDHPSIVKIYDLGEHNGELYMAMELLEGEDLRALLSDPAEVPTAHWVRLFEEIARGVAYAHGRGVIHRDLKPANIIVTAAGRVKILDFGLARVAERATLTRQGVILGTPDYMSPEQATGRHVDARSDIFSAGGVFYECLTHQKPFSGKTLHAVLYQIIQSDPEPVLACNPDVPARLAELVHRMLGKSADARPQTMDEVAARLGELRVALSRSRSRSALPVPPSEPVEGATARLKGHLERAARLAEASQHRKALGEAMEALALDPDSAAAIERSWRALRAIAHARKTLPPPPATSARLAELLQRATHAAPQEARRALAELCLLAPDDPRVAALARDRGRG
jgi:serine/threonine protein kinase